MTGASTESYYPPVSRFQYLPRLYVVHSSPDAQDVWIEVHHVVQEQLAVLESDVRRSLAGVRATTGSTRGEHFLLFSYVTFSLPDSDIDPVVVGMTFKQADQGVDMEADVSGESTGDLISSVILRMALGSRKDLLAAVHESASELLQSVKAIAAALKNSSRGVE